MITRLALLPPRLKASAGQRVRLTVCVAALLAPLNANAADDLSDIYELARAYDPTIQAAAATFRAARQQLPLARSAFLPQISARLSGSLNDINDDLSDTFGSTQLTLSLSQSLYHRSNSALLDQAQLNVMQAGATLESARQNLITRVSEAYFEVLRAEADLAFSQAELQAIGRQKEQAEKRFDVGLATVTDVRDAQAQFDLAVAQEVASQNALSTNQEVLRLLSGTEITNLAALKDDIPLVPPTPANIDEWVEVAKNQNLDLSTSRLELESSSVQVRAERGASFPTLDILAIGSSSTTQQDGRRDTDSGELRLELSMPLYTGGRIKAQVASARAEVEAAEANLRVQELTVVQQARDSYRGVLTNISRVRALRQALDSTQKSAEASSAAFRAGTETSVDVLRALRDTFSARSDYVSARYDYILNTLSLKAAAGTLGEQDLQAVNALLEQVAE